MFIETIDDFMEDWLKKWGQGLSWQEFWGAHGWKPKKQMVIDLDDIYKDGKLFGYTVIHVDDEKGTIVRVEENGHKYIVSFKFDWENFVLRIEAHPLGQDAFIRFSHSLDSLFRLKGNLTEYAVKDTVHRIITEFERRNNNI